MGKTAVRVLLEQSNITNSGQTNRQINKLLGEPTVQGKTMKTVRISPIKEISEDRPVELLRRVRERKTEYKMGDRK